MLLKRMMLKCFKYLLLTRQNNNRNSKCTSNPINLILSKFIDALTEKIGKFDIAFDKLPIAETSRHGDIVADTENVLQTVFVYINF